MSRKKSKAKTKPQKAPSITELARDFTRQCNQAAHVRTAARGRRLVTSKRVLMSIGVPAAQAQAETEKAWKAGFSEIEYDRQGRCIVRNNSVLRVREYAKSIGMVDLQHG